MRANNARTDTTESGKPKNQRYVIVCGDVFRWAEKEPFVPSGKSVLGAIEYDRDAETVKCHECGKWMHSISQGHLKVHGVSAREYKINHGLFQKTPLMSPVRVARMRWGRDSKVLDRLRAQSRAIAPRKARGIETAGWAEAQNRNGVCRAQVLAAIKTKAILGRCPTEADIGQRFVRAAQRHFRSWSSACAAAGFRPNAYGKGRPEIDRATLLETLRDYYVLNGRVPRARDCGRRARLCCLSTYCKEFGTWGSALEAAGLSRVRASESNTSGEVAA